MPSIVLGGHVEPPTRYLISKRSRRLRLSNEDAALDRLWRQRFDQPLPMRGASAIVRTILVQNGVDERLVASEIQAARRLKV